MRRTARFGWAVAAVLSLTAPAALAGPSLYDIAPFMAPDAFAAQFWGQTPAQPGAPAPAAAPFATPAAVVAAPTVPLAGAASPTVLEPGLRPIPPVVAAPSTVPLEVRTARTATTTAGRFLGMDRSRVYLAGNLGMAAHNDASNVGTAVSNTVDYDTGLALQGAIGYEFTDQWNLEFELAWRRAAAGTVTLAGGTAVVAMGTLSSLALMVNGLYSFDIDGPLTPYLLVGGGFARVKADAIDAGNVPATADAAWAVA